MSVYMNAKLRAALRRLVELHEAAERSVWAPGDRARLAVQAAVVAERAREAGIDPRAETPPAAASSCSEAAPPASKQELPDPLAAVAELGRQIRGES